MQVLGFWCLHSDLTQDCTIRRDRQDRAAGSDALDLISVIGFEIFDVRLTDIPSTSDSLQEPINQFHTKIFDFNGDTCSAGILHKIAHLFVRAP